MHRFNNRATQGGNVSKAQSMSNLSAPSPPTLLNWISILGLGLIWGGSFMTVHIALQDLGPFQLVSGRVVLAALVLVGLTYALGQRLPSLATPEGWRLWGFALGTGLLSNALPFALIAWAQLHVTSGFAGVSMALVPLFTLMAAHFLLPGERLTPMRTLGFALGLAGVMVLIGTDSLRPEGGGMEFVARAVCILATLSYALGSIMTRRCPQVDAVAFAAASLSCAALITVPMMLLTEGLPTQIPPTAALLAVLYLGLLPTGAAMIIVVHVVRSAGPTFLTQTNYHVPVWSVIFGTLILAEPLPAQFLIALGLILGGLAVSRMRWRRLR